jgi:shikimate kinase
MARVLITGMSGVGKSTVLVELARQGHEVVDTDDGPWIDLKGSEPLWREDLMSGLLDKKRDRHLFVAGTVANQGLFYERFEAVVLLTAPIDTLLERIEARTTNPFGKTPGERGRVIDDTAQVEPLLRRGATEEIDTRRPLAEVVDRLVQLADAAGITFLP